MELSIIEIKTITAADGMILTNGETYGKVVYLGVNDSPENWYEITAEEAEQLQNKYEPGVVV